MKTLSMLEFVPKTARSFSKRILGKCIYVRTSNTIYRIEKESIIFLQAQGNYTIIHTDKTRICSSKTLKYYVDILSEDRFIKTHQSYYVNMDYVSEFHFDSRNKLVLVDGIHIPVSRNRKMNILSEFQNV